MDFGSLHLDHLQFLESILFEQLGREVQVNDYVFLSGGCINQAVRVISTGGDYFVKWNETTDDQPFACEAQGLELIRQTNTLAVPEVLGYGQKAQRAYLILEHLPFNHPKADYWQHFGQTLAQMHGHSNEAFGLSFNNFIGLLEQHNEWLTDSTAFFIERRLKPMAGLALYNQALPRNLYDKFQKLYEKLPEILPAEKPAMLHGDLWHGNILTGRDSHACLIDPAVYYGNREAEIAFTHLFGGFEQRFYEAYQEALPLEPGFQQRIEIYNLYPLLVHVNLFGSGYLPGIERVLKKF